MRPSFVGMIVGMVLGFAGVLGGFTAFLLVGLLALIGFVAGKVVEGRIDLSQYLGGGDRPPR